MEVKFLRITIGTEFKQKKSVLIRFIKLLLFFVPVANPDYESKIHLVKEWLIEFDENDQPFREIGINKDGDVVISGPNERDYGYWLDTNMRYSDFKGTPVSKKKFEALWEKSKLYRHQ
ncbi:MAG: hypothetical protein L3J83_06595 [Proteobacteria bacterium]|nr:hypothetical protein [Pseudomonadota bacterium]